MAAPKTTPKESTAAVVVAARSTPRTKARLSSAPATPRTPAARAPPPRATPSGGEMRKSSGGIPPVAKKPFYGFPSNEAEEDALDVRRRALAHAINNEDSIEVG